MSGAPIIQNNKFVGAVTHVLVNDPTVGNGVFADIMIKEVAKTKRIRGVETWKKDKGNILIKTIIVFIILLIILSLGFLAHLYLQEIELSEEEPKNIIATFEELEKKC